MNELLLWISARCSGSYQSFRAKVAELDARPARSVARYREAEWALSRLAHAEFGPAAAGAGWRVAPPVLAAGDHQGPWRAILCGARTPHLLSAIAAAAGCEVEVTPQTRGPDTIEISAESACALAGASVRAGIPLQWNASLAVLAACGTPKTAALTPITMPIGGWTVARFSKTQLAWVSSSPAEASSVHSGLFQFKAERQATTYVLVEAGHPHACDPAAGKFRILGRRHRALSYDSLTQAFSVRASCRPPQLVERALVLCSGQLPTLRDGYVSYSRVDHSTAAAVASLLCQRLS